MKTATFYLLNPSSPLGQLSHAESIACMLATQQWRQGKRVLIACENQRQAERLDEALWSQEIDCFVPHNLAGEGPKQGAPVEIAWPEKRGNAPRDLLITLSPYFMDFAIAFQEVIDFVPHEENLKTLARERYKAYRRTGFHLTTVATPIN